MASPQLSAQQQKIDEMLKIVAAKFEQRKKIFENTKLLELCKQRTELKAEVELLKARLIEAETNGGIKQVTKIRGFDKNSSTKTETPAKAEMNANKEAMNDADAVVQKLAKGSKAGEATKQPAKGAPSKTGTGAEGGAAKSDDSIDIGRIDLRVGRILKAEKHPDADTLYVEQVDVGEEQPRTIISGLVRHVPIEQVRLILLKIMSISCLVV
ncbi:unnamed protein product [Gongylonema pulchrum]|uniref:tRNA-binding domain-containing protein n=1 Tax=Gongylonema pulchrum TaxID=637853 RepID=A0A183DBB2_9BILA|nr:unnamed protein product [Gongylonema pulchrum]